MSSFEQTLANHGARIGNLESAKVQMETEQREDRQRIEDKLDALKNMVICAMGAALLAVVTGIIPLIWPKGH